ncbi:MAG: PepSY domain-containing protein [Planctomycetota bacterium]|nr:PepSY domain-containing protein [Planctomycetota bacterium]
MKRVPTVLSLVLALGGLSACESHGQRAEEDHEVPVTTQPKVTLCSAIATARLQEPDGRVLSAEVENEDGRVICSVLLSVAGGAREVNLDAESGVVLGTENEALDKEASTLLEEIGRDPRRATTSATQAIEAALKVVPGAWALEAQLASEEGSIVYEVLLVDGHEGKLARISAADGHLVSLSDADDDEEEDEEGEAKERD